MKIQKDTVIEVYNYMNSKEWQVLEHKKTELLKTFEVGGITFEARIKTEKGTGRVLLLLCIDSIVIARIYAQDAKKRVAAENFVDTLDFPNFDFEGTKEVVEWKLEYVKNFKK